MSDLKKWLIVAVVPALSFVVGIAAFPRPRAVADEKAEFDRNSLGTAVRTTKPTPNSPVDVVLGDAVRVVGADLPKQKLQRGDKLDATFHFGCEAELENDWQIFVHVDAQRGSFRIHGDHFPVGGRYPTTLWKEGEFIADAWSVNIPRDATPGTYDVWIGFYEGEERLPFTDGDRKAQDGLNRVRVGTVEIE